MIQQCVIFFTANAYEALLELLVLRKGFGKNLVSPLSFCMATVLYSNHLYCMVSGIFFCESPVVLQGLGQ